MSNGNSNSERPPASKPLSADRMPQGPAAAGCPREHDGRAEERLIQQCLAGDETAWERLYRRHHPRLHRAIRALLKSDAVNLHLVEEIAARVWYALLRDECRLLATYDVDRDSTLDGFLMGLARIEILQNARSERRRRSHELIGGRRRLEEQRVSDQQTASLLDEFASTLTAGQQEFMEQFLLGRAESDPDSGPNGLADTSVRSRRHRIRRKLNNFLKDL